MYEKHFTIKASICNQTNSVQQLLSNFWATIHDSISKKSWKYENQILQNILYSKAKGHGCHGMTENILHGKAKWNKHFEDSITQLYVLCNQ